jgi:hypothetical protein
LAFAFALISLDSTDDVLLLESSEGFDRSRVMWICGSDSPEVRFVSDRNGIEFYLLYEVIALQYRLMM